MSEKFLNNLTRSGFEKKQIENNNVDFHFDYLKGLNIDNLNLGGYYCFSLESKKYFREKDFWNRKVYLKHNFNLLKLIEEANGLGIEIGGPTRDGYQFYNLQFNDRGDFLGYDLIDLFQKYKEKNKIFISNILDGVYSLDQESKNFILKGKVDFIADGKKMPIQNQSVSAVFASSIGIISYNYLLKLKNQGIFVPENLLKLAESFNNQNKYLSLNEEHILQKKIATELRNFILEEAKRILKNNGIFVFQNINKEDVLNSIQKGFEVVQLEFFTYLKNKEKITSPDKIVLIKK